MRKKLKSVREEYERFLFGSNCHVNILQEVNGQQSLQIMFVGALSKIPSLKNSKIPGKNFISNKAQGQLKAMTDLFKHSLCNRTAPKFDEDIFVSVIIGAGSRVDEDNGFAAIKDWLEPKSKNERGWGIGLVDDDKVITGYAIHGKRIGVEISPTIITVRPYQAHKEVVANFVSRMSDIKLSEFEKLEQFIKKTYPTKSTA